ncbi:MAG: hypothetical protein NTW96_17865 [Planctomycetia bacterium]|nr:hypothetical protein [Planctomycetia bacterium]
MRSDWPERTRVLTWASIVIGCIAGLLVLVAPTLAAELRLGTAAVKITPPDGTPIAGPAVARDSEGVLDDVYAKAAVLDDGKTKIALVVCDLSGVPVGIVFESRRIIAEKTGIPADHVMISATHTHTGPSPFGSGPYVKQLPPWIAQAVQQANDRLTAAKISYGSENEPDISFIRRFWMKDGTIGWNPGKLNPNILRPIGTIDPRVNVIYAETADKRALLTYVNFANHLDTTGGTRISADFPATLARRLADYRGPEMLTIFANGACGNINHVNVHWDAPQTSPEEAKRLGTILAADVLKSYEDMKEVEDVALRARCKTVQLPLAKHTDEELRRAREILAQPGAGATFLERVKANRIVDVAAAEGRPVQVEVQVMTLGSDVAWVALPGEIFVELGLSVKAASPFRQTNVVELANGGFYYIPHQSAYAEGQYEVISTRYAEGSGEMLVTAAIGLLGELHKEATGR